MIIVLQPPSVSSSLRARRLRPCAQSRARSGRSWPRLFAMLRPPFQLPRAPCSLHRPCLETSQWRDVRRGPAPTPSAAPRAETIPAPIAGADLHHCLCRPRRVRPQTTTEASDARRLLYQLHDELLQSNPSAAASLAEGLEECLTVAALRLTPKLRDTLSSTNCIETGFSVVDRICHQVKRWQGSDHRLRWVGSALSFAESSWNRIHGYRHLLVLISALNAAYRLRCPQAPAAPQSQGSAA